MAFHGAGRKRVAPSPRNATEGVPYRREVFFGRCSACSSSCAVTASLSGCSHVPPRPERPSLDPVSAARTGHGAVRREPRRQDQCQRAEDSARRCWRPWSLIDANHDGALTVDEITARMRQWKESPSVVVSGSTQVFLDGQPLVGATVTYSRRSSWARPIRRPRE